MEIRNYFRVIRKFIGWFVGPIVGVVLLSLILSLIYKENFQAPVAMAVNRKPQQAKTDQYQYDSYYAIQANSVMADQFYEWLKGNAVLPVIYQQAVLKEENSLLQKEWKVENHSPQDIELIFRGRDRNRVSTLAQAAIETLKQKKDEFTGTGEASLGAVNVPSEVIVITKETSLVLNLLIGLLAGILVGLIFVYFKAIFSSNEIQNTKS